MLKRVAHPGEILEGALEKLGMSPFAFACYIDAPPNRISQIITGRCSVTREMAPRFGCWLGTDSQFWLNLQRQSDLVSADPGGFERLAQV